MSASETSEQKIDELWAYLVKTAEGMMDERMYVRFSRDREGYLVTVAYHPAWNWNGYATHAELDVCIERIKRGVLEWIQRGRLSTTKTKVVVETTNLPTQPPAFGTVLPKRGGQKLPKAGLM